VDSPHIITITELRRRTAAIISGPLAEGAPVFVVQRGSVAAVVLSRRTYDRLVAEGHQSRQGGSAVARDMQSEGGGAAEQFGRLPRGTLFETPWGLTDDLGADFFMENDIPVRPHRYEWIDQDLSDVGGVSWTDRLTEFRVEVGTRLEAAHAEAAHAEAARSEAARSEADPSG